MCVVMRSESSTKGGEESQSEKEVPMHAVLSHMFGVAQALDAVESDETKNEKRNGVADGSEEAGWEGFMLDGVGFENEEERTFRRDRAETTPTEKTKDPTPRSMREVPQFSTLAKRRGKMRKSTGEVS
jgi:hypothetical protein